jgi:diguanylate cyclase (GGDEF)-like protein
VIRLLGVLALAAPFAIGTLFLLMPDVAGSLVDGQTRLVVASVSAAIAGVTMTAAVLYIHSQVKLRRLVMAMERLAAGDYAVTVAARGNSMDGRLARSINSISTALADTHDKATVDRLTGVANRQALLGELFAEVERAGRYERPLSVAFVDIDHFKAVNDSYGHAAGDVVLRGVAQTISENLRASDRIGRYGGEEFMLILTETDVDEGAVLTEKLRTLVQRQRFAVDGNPGLSVTISIGIAGGIGPGLRMDSLVRDADAAMYSAKSLGRNQTYVFAEPDDDARVPRAPISAAGRAQAVALGKEAREAATLALTSVLNPLPHYRGQPSALIASIVVALARQLELPDAEVDRIRIAALLHDVGKIAVPEDILEKPAALTSAEWRTVVQHPRIGQVILEQAASLKEAVPIILHHHERYGGHGYPYGLRANEIPLGARIVAVADAYDAMTHDRPYKRAMSHENAIEELRRHAGTQFDPELVGLFCDMYATHAPEPDPAVLAMTAANGAHHAASAALVLPDRAATSRPRRSSHSRSAQTTTDAGGSDGSLAVGPLGSPASGASNAPLPEPMLRPIRSVAPERPRPRTHDSATG